MTRARFVRASYMCEQHNKKTNEAKIEDLEKHDLEISGLERYGAGLRGRDETCPVFASEEASRTDQAPDDRGGEEDFGCSSIPLTSS